eukprot:1126256-Pelagomonas_calceolata.AAC.3
MVCPERALCLLHVGLKGPKRCVGSAVQALYNCCTRAHVLGGSLLAARGPRRARALCGQCCTSVIPMLYQGVLTGRALCLLRVDSKGQGAV